MKGIFFERVVVFLGLRKLCLVEKDISCMAFSVYFLGYPLSASFLFKSRMARRKESSVLHARKILMVSPQITALLIEGGWQDE